MHPITQTETGAAVPTIEWIPSIRKTPKSKWISEYYNSFLSLLYPLIYEETMPRLLPEMKQFLQLSPDTGVGDWFLFEQNTVIRIYGYK